MAASPDSSVLRPLTHLAAFQLCARDTAQGHGSQVQMTAAPAAGSVDLSVFFALGLVPITRGSLVPRLQHLLLQI